MKSNPYKIGITGGIGAGKSIVSSIFQILGIPIYNADHRAKVMMVNDPFIIEQVKKIFGEKAYIEGNLNRSFIASEAFNNETLLHSLNKIVHPAVQKDFEHWVESNFHALYVLKEAALLFEADSYKALDKIITVYAPVELRVERVLERDYQRTREEVLSIISKQSPEEEKLKKADYIIYNDNTQLLIPQVLEIHSKIISISKNHI